MKRLIVFTDGACQGSIGTRVAGAGVWIPSRCEGYSSKVQGQQTNQRAELTAIWITLEIIEEPMTIITDSSYCIGCLRDWWPNWVKNGWVNAKKKPVENQDIIKPCLELMKSRDVVFEHVRGHSGNPGNDKADEVARSIVEGFKVENVEEINWESSDEITLDL